jgi:4-hydroxy-tetrahydrodipicolinate reductase
MRKGIKIMTPIKIMINGLPGNMAQIIAEKAMSSNEFEIVPYSFTGPEIEAREFKINNLVFSLIPPNEKIQFWAKNKSKIATAISIDYTHPSAIVHNCEWYCDHDIHFVLGTTGGDRNRIVETVQNSKICAVIAPNMGKQIVGFQAMLAYAAKEFPGLFDGYSMEITESHQRGKADVSGTARSLIPLFQTLGVDVHEKDIFMERNPEIQLKQLGVPQSYLNGHAWHTYSLVSEDQTVSFQFTHNVNGRSIYAFGTLDAARYLYKKILQKNSKTVYSMIDVLKGE